QWCAGGVRDRHRRRLVHPGSGMGDAPSPSHQEPASLARSGQRLTEDMEVEVMTTIPRSHLDLVECPPVAALSTVMPDGQPQTSVVWCDFDGTCVRANTMRGFRKERNMSRNPRVPLL